MAVRDMQNALVEQIRKKNSARRAAREDAQVASSVIYSQNEQGGEDEMASPGNHEVDVQSETGDSLKQTKVREFQTEGNPMDVTSNPMYDEYKRLLTLTSEEVLNMQQRLSRNTLTLPTAEERNLQIKVDMARLNAAKERLRKSSKSGSDEMTEQRPQVKVEVMPEKETEAQKASSSHSLMNFNFIPKPVTQFFTGLASCISNMSSKNNVVKSENVPSTIPIARVSYSRSMPGKREFTLEEQNRFEDATGRKPFTKDVASSKKAQTEDASGEWRV